MYSGGFYPYATQEAFWAYWSRYIWVNRYMDPPKRVYDDLFMAVRDKDYFVLTTNVDHCFQKVGRKHRRFSPPGLPEQRNGDVQTMDLNPSPEGFDKNRLFYTQGDYGLFQCSEPCCKETWDNEDAVRDMVLAQGFVIGGDGDLNVPEGTEAAMAVPGKLLPRCPHCGRPLTMNLRSDDRFVEDAGWHAAAKRYLDFTQAHSADHILYLEIGVGWNTPGIIKFNFWDRAKHNPNAIYACLNHDDARIPEGLEDRGIAIAGDSAQVISALTFR
jgi:NAD-dependent SIR2 family protein deacetylase